LLWTALFSVSFGLSLSVFASGNFYLQSRIYYLVFISSLISLFIVQVPSEDNIFPGQNTEYIVEITGKVLADSKEIGGGQKIFSLQLSSAEDINSTRTSASGSLTVASQVDVYKGQFVSLAKKNILVQDSSFIFIDQKNISVLEWGTAWDILIMEKRAQILVYLKQHIRRMGVGPASLFTALFAGIKENPKGELFTALRRAGGSHILALSGMHLGIISFGILFVLTGLFGRRISFAVTLIVILFYVFLVSAGPSLTRAVILFILIGFLSLSGSRIDIFHILSICFLIQILLDPNSAYMLSFQLSYLALGGIILGSGRINRMLPGLIPGGIRNVLSASISAQLFTAPLVLYSFGVIYPVGIISGIILVPIITLFIWIGIIGLLPMPWILQRLVFSADASLYKAIEISADIFSRFPALELKGAIEVGMLLLIIYLIHFFWNIEFTIKTKTGNRKTK
jgi:competence protein ComEC